MVLRLDATSALSYEYDRDYLLEKTERETYEE